MDKIEIARNPSTSLKVLEKLADDKDWLVRRRVAQYPNCPIKTLEKLADDECLIVRSSVTKNPNCPEYIKTYFEARDYMSKYYEQD